MREFVTFGLLILLAGCSLTGVHSGSADPLSANLRTGSPEWRGLKFVRNRCSDCHAVEPGAESPMPGAPTFMSVANRPGMTRDSLNGWMREHDNYPRAMYFEIPAEHIDDVVSYVLTLHAVSDLPSRSAPRPHSRD